MGKKASILDTSSLAAEKAFAATTPTYVRGHRSGVKSVKIPATDFMGLPTSAEFTDNTDDLAAWDATTATLTPAAGVFYVGLALTAMILVIPETATPADEFRIKFTIATGATLANFVLSAITSWIGGAPDLAAGNTYEVSIQDGVGVICLVEAV